MGNILKISFFDRILLPFFGSYNLQTYFGIVLFVLIAVFLCSLLATLAYIFSLSPVQDSEKRSEYECGFEPFDNATRLPFDVHFYLVGVLFLIFDVEIALFFPWVLSLHITTWYSFYLILGFIVVLGIGFLYEWKRGALLWPSQEAKLPTNFNIKSGSLLSIVFVSSNESYATQIFGSLVVEIYLTLTILLLLTILALGLEKNVNKKTLAIKSLHAFQVSIAYAIVLCLVQLVFGTPGFLFHGYSAVSLYTVIMKMLTLFSCFFIFKFSDKYVKEHEQHLLEYPLVLMLASLLIVLLVTSTNLIAAFISLVGFSLNLYVLIFFDAKTASSQEAGAKYFFLSAFSSGLILYGIFIIFFVTGSTQFFEIANILYMNIEKLQHGAVLLQFGLLLVFVGLFFKLSAFPGHLWAADVYEGSPDPVMAFFILPVKVAVLSFVYQLLTITFEPLLSLWQPLLVAAASASILIGCFSAVSEKRTKRFFAYTSINQIGFLLIGLATGSLDGYRATLMYLVIYVVINIGMLYIFLNVRRADEKTMFYLTDFTRFGHKYSATSWSLVVVLLSIAGIPPLAGFFGKYFLLISAQQQELYGLAIIGLATSFVSAYYYLRLIKIIWFDKATEDTRSVSFNNQHLDFTKAAEWILWSFLIYSTELLSEIENNTFCIVTSVDGYALPLVIIIIISNFLRPYLHIFKSINKCYNTHVFFFL